MANSIIQDVKNARKCENINDPIDTYVVDFIAMVFSRIFIKLHIIPNAVTVISGLVGAAGGVLLSFRTLPTDLVGVFLIVLSAVFDASDGQVARLTKHYSNFGRTLDGFMDGVVYLSIYVGFCIRLYFVNIPFTQTPWRFWIIPAVIVVMLLHSAQMRIMDYFKNLHMYMFTRGSGSELSRSKKITEQIASQKKGSFERIRLTFYRSYTKMQERIMPKTQILLDGIEERGGTEELFEKYVQKSRKYVMASNLLSFNLRTIVLFVLLFLPFDAECLLVPFVILILEPIRLIIIAKYEKLAADLTVQTASAATDKEK